MPPPRKSSTKPKRKLPKATQAFLDAVGTFIEHWGFKRVQGEIWGVVYLAEQPVTATEVASCLGVSKALVSLAMGELLEYRVVLPAPGHDAREQRLVPNENLGEAITTVLRLREQRFIADARSSLAALQQLPSGGDLMPLAAQRLTKLDEFIGDVQKALAFVVTVVEAEGKQTTPP